MYTLNSASYDKWQTFSEAWITSLFTLLFEKKKRNTKKHKRLLLFFLLRVKVFFWKHVTGRKVKMVAKMREKISRKSGKCTFETPKKSLLLPICFSTSERKFFSFQTQIINKETTTYYTTQISHFLHHFPDFLHYCYSCRSQLDFDYFLTIFPNLIYRFSRAKLKNS